MKLLFVIALLFCLPGCLTPQHTADLFHEALMELREDENVINEEPAQPSYSEKVQAFIHNTKRGRLKRVVVPKDMQPTLFFTQISPENLAWDGWKSKRGTAAYWVVTESEGGQRVAKTATVKNRKEWLKEFDHTVKVMVCIVNNSKEIWAYSKIVEVSNGRPI